jgi:hypothetical protein
MGAIGFFKRMHSHRPMTAESLRWPRSFTIIFIIPP